MVGRGLARLLLALLALLAVSLSPAWGQFEGELQSDRFAAYEDRAPSRVRRRGQDSLRG